MKIYCVKWRKDTENIDPKMFRTKNKRLNMQANVLFGKLKSQDLQKRTTSKRFIE